MSDSYSIPFTAIIFGSRYRNTKDYGDLKGTIASMERVGSIHPIGLNRRAPVDDAERVRAHEGWVYELVDGGRRYKCLEKMKVDRLYHASYGDPKHLGFIFAQELSPEKKREMELDENLYRLQCNWIDDCLAVDDIHKLKRSQNPRDTWGQEHTAALLGPGFSKSKVSIIGKVAKLLRAKDKEILKCKSLGEAQNVLLKRASDEGLKELKKRVLPKAANTETLLETFNIKMKGGEEPCPTVPVQKTPRDSQSTIPIVHSTHTTVGSKVTPKSDPESVTIPLSCMFLHGDFLKHKFTESFHHIVTDIPYGIDMENLDDKMIESVRDEHDIAQNVAMFKPFLEKAYSLLRPHGFLVFCFDLDHWNVLQKHGRAVGFHIQDWPFIACKTSPCRNTAAAFNRTKNFEAVAYFRKDEKSVLRKQGLSSWSTYDFSVDRRSYSHPFAKPFALWKDIYDAIAFTGQTVLDPYAGEWSAGIAAVKCGLVPYGVEIKEEHYNRGLQHMRKAYEIEHKGKVEFV